MLAFPLDFPISTLVLSSQTNLVLQQQWTFSKLFVWYSITSSYCLLFFQPLSSFFCRKSFRSLEDRFQLWKNQSNLSGPNLHVRYPSRCYAQEKHQENQDFTFVPVLPRIAILLATRYGRVSFLSDTILVKIWKLRTLGGKVAHIQVESKSFYQLLKSSCTHQKSSLDDHGQALWLF